MRADGPILTSELRRDDISEFEPCLSRWQLVADGPVMPTKTSLLLPVLHAGVPAILKRATHEEERRGGRMMVWFKGQAAARVLAHEGDLLLLERATGTRSLVGLARSGRDDEASRILCETVAALNRPQAGDWPPLVPLERWFRALPLAAAKHGGILAAAASVSRELLADQGETVPLHGDVHHENVLDFGAAGWLAIDPKALIGDRGFDYANMFCNPDHETAVNPERFSRRIDIVAEMAGLEHQRLLSWVLAWAGLSAAWFLAADASAKTPLAIAELATQRLRLPR